ncbi:hypothetical protein PSHT_15879 [Puccinia striiformis]|uniref:Uncharacterized protein n=1 Tax=Puccinia striiformis TaxID=27350 RepID=A0A2S4UCJ1_9BASI|nr:hypothetical protein PSHT_15879 [Puccinia striiformis]
MAPSLKALLDMVKASMQQGGTQARDTIEENEEEGEPTPMSAEIGKTTSLQRSPQATSKTPVEPPTRKEPKKTGRKGTEQALTAMTQAHAATLKELLSTSFVEGSGTANDPVDTKKETAKTNKRANIATVLELAVKASVAGNTEEANKLFDICTTFTLASKDRPKTTVMESNVGTLYTSVIKPKDTSKTKSFELIELSIPISKRPADILPGVVMLNNNTRPSGEDIGFIPFFEKNLRDLHGLLPLTIFNTIWQAKAINHDTLNLGKKSKSDDSGKDKTRYLAYEYPKELRQTYAEWSINHQRL